MSATKEQLHKIHLIFVKSAKYAWNSNTFRISNKSILTECNLVSLNSHIQYAALNFIHKILYYGRPDSLFNLFCIPSRKAKDIVPYDKLSSKTTKNFYIYKALALYNRLKSELKCLPPKKFKVKLRKCLKYEGMAS